MPTAHTSIGIGEIKKAVKINEEIISDTPRKLQKEEAKLSKTHFTLKKETGIAKNMAQLSQTHSLEQKTEPEGQLSVDVYQTEKSIAIIAPIAGVKTENISVTITEDVISIRGKRTPGFIPTKENFISQECFWGVFSRSIILPHNVDISKINASFKNGILTIDIPKTELVKTKIIKIKQSTF